MCVSSLAPILHDVHVDTSLQTENLKALVMAKLVIFFHGKCGAIITRVEEQGICAVCDKKIADIFQKQAQRVEFSFCSIFHVIGLSAGDNNTEEPTTLQCTLCSSWSSKQPSSITSH